MTSSSAAQIRRDFLAYFTGHAHLHIKSSPLVPPAGDTSLMFINAGMVPFKDNFVGLQKPPAQRAVSVQKCMRVSGKHNDLEEVGRTTRHHTFFEMMGNFSFGDYFKEGAIAYAWEFLTKVVALDPKRLWITVFGGAPGIPADEEARRLWRQIGQLGDDRIRNMGVKDNFWSMGDVGPCGPCSEIHYDQGEGPVTAADFDNGRIVEVWNVVFMQFNRHTDGVLAPLPAPSVDTGMGLERLAAVLQGQTSNYHTDLFLPLVHGVAEIAGRPYGRGPSNDDVSMRVIADHARATAFLVADGIVPSNEGRGYVLRRIMRRAIRHGRRLSLDKPFLAPSVTRVVEVLGQAYPELAEAQSLMVKLAELEELTFGRTLDTGLKLLDAALRGGAAAALAPAGSSAATTLRQLDGATAFRLYDTYGFPLDLTCVLAEEAGVAVDVAGFEAHLQAQKARSRSHSAQAERPESTSALKDVAARLGPTPFIGYPYEDEPPSARPGTWRWSHDEPTKGLEACVEVVALLVDGVSQNAVVGPLPPARRLEVVLSPTPFYGEAGGQVGDTGWLRPDGAAMLPRMAEVVDTQKPVAGLTVQHVRLHDGRLHIGQALWAGYPVEVRKQTRAHHTATHLLHGALRHVLGDHVKQAGSRVHPTHLRFDYTHFAALSAEELIAIEADANARIAADNPVHTQEIAYDEAKKLGAIALFGEKYGDRVRVLTMGKSVELCGGTHARHTGELELLIIGREQALQSGVRRIEARVGAAAQASLDTMQAQLDAAHRLASGDSPVTPDRDAAAATTMPADMNAPAMLAVWRARHVLGNVQPALGAADPVAAPSSRPRDGDGTRPWTLPLAQAVRRQWQQLQQLTSCRGSDIEAIMALWQASGETTVTLRSVAALLVRADALARQQKSMASQSTGGVARELAAGAVALGAVRLVCREVSAEGNALRELADGVKAIMPQGAIICLGTSARGRASLVIMVTPDLAPRLSAADLIQKLLPSIDGRGGGKPQLAQAGGNRAAGLSEAFSVLREALAGEAKPGAQKGLLEA